MVVKNVTNNLFDVFWKDGWDNCVRVKKIGSDFRVVKAFKRPPRDVFQFIKRTFQLNQLLIQHLRILILLLTLIHWSNKMKF
jgi:hypothetical protein